jgi:DNA-binding Lrp family transcriptional regulator
MPIAYVLINTVVGSENAVFNNLGEIPEIKEAHTVYGLYDIIAFLETNSMHELNETVNSKIKGLEKIRYALTFIAN